MRWLATSFGVLALVIAVALCLRSQRASSKDALDQPVAASEAERSRHDVGVELAPPSALRPDSAATSHEGAPGSREAVASPAALVAGRIEVEGGLPAGEEVVVVAHAHRSGVSRLHSRTLEAPVARDGSFELRVPADSSSVGLELDSLLLFLEDEVEVRPGTLDVVLRPKVLAALRGRVHRPLGLLSASEESAIHVSAGRRSSVYADADGSFCLVVEPDVSLQLVATYDSWDSLETRQEIDALRAGEVRWVELVLEPLLALRGLVTDESGAPLEGAEVSLVLEPTFGSRFDWPFTDAELTGADGSFVLGRLRPGACEVEARAPGRRGERRKLELPADCHEPLHFVLAPATTVHGRVVGPDGAARADALVRECGEPGRVYLLSKEELRIEQRGERLRTDAGGRFTLICDEPAVWLVASAKGFADSLPFALEPGTDTEEIVLTLRPACSLRVRVSSDDGELAAGIATLRSEDGTRQMLGVNKGTIEADDLPPGRAWIEIGPYQLNSDSRIDSPYTGTVEVELTPGVETHAELRLVREK